MDGFSVPKSSCRRWIGVLESMTKRNTSSVVSTVDAAELFSSRSSEVLYYSASPVTKSIWDRIKEKIFAEAYAMGYCSGRFNILIIGRNDDLSDDIGI